MKSFYSLVLASYLGFCSLSFAEVAPSLLENSEYKVAIIVWGNSDTPLAHDITNRLRTLGFNVPNPSMHKGSRYPNYTEKVEVRYTQRGQDKINVILRELEAISELTVESKIFKDPEAKGFALAGDIQIQFPIILP